LPKPRIFVTRRIPAPGLDPLSSVCEVDLWTEPRPPPRTVLLERVRGCAGVLSLLTDPMDAEVMDAAGPGLRVISNLAAGVNNIDLEAAQARGIAVGHTPDVLTEATADLAFALLIAASRRMGEAMSSVAAGQWRTWDPLGFVGGDLVGATLGVVGLGRIGRALARRCHLGWNMRVLYAGGGLGDAAADLAEAVQVPFATLLAESDFVSVHAPLTAETHHLFDAGAFRRMKPSAVFVNTARGPIHDQRALYAALATGEIAAAGLDVTDPEPMAPDDPLLTLANCIILPHIGSATRTSRDAMAKIAAENLIAGVQGRPLLFSP
jgi:glyoxylate reductase